MVGISARRHAGDHDKVKQKLKAIGESKMKIKINMDSKWFIGGALALITIGILAVALIVTPPNKPAVVMTTEQLQSYLTGSWPPGADGLPHYITSAQCEPNGVTTSGAGHYTCTVKEDNGISHDVRVSVLSDGSYRADSFIQSFSIPPSR